MTKESALSRAKYNELNKDNVAKAAREKQIAFGKAKARADELLNSVKDANKRIAMLEGWKGKTKDKARLA